MFSSARAITLLIDRHTEGNNSNNITRNPQSWIKKLQHSWARRRQWRSSPFGYTFGLTVEGTILTLLGWYLVFLVWPSDFPSRTGSILFLSCDFFGTVVCSCCSAPCQTIPYLMMYITWKAVFGHLLFFIPVSVEEKLMGKSVELFLGWHYCSI